MNFLFLFLLFASVSVGAYELTSSFTVTLQQTNEITINDTSLTYTISVGSLPMRTEQGKEQGSLTFLAYRKELADKTRPITFIFGGGPGGASSYLALCGLGPKRFLTLEEGQSIAPPYNLIDNPNTILDFTDLVFVDPIGTGFSRMAEEENLALVHGVNSDIRSLGDFICDYITATGCWTSPKYLAGSSYGTHRACGLAQYLACNGLYLNGLILMGCALDYQTLVFMPDNELPFALFLPSFAATAWYHGRLNPNTSLEQTIENARRFALDTFAPALLVHGFLPPALYQDLSYWTGLPVSTIQEYDGLINDAVFLSEFPELPQQHLGRIDSRVIGPAFSPYSYTDPSNTPYLGILTAAIHTYLFEELEYKNIYPRYVSFNEDALINWGWPSDCYTNMMQSLRIALLLNPELRIFNASGYFDLATPFAAVEHSFKRLRLPLAKNIKFCYYEGGHGFFMDPEVMSKFKKDLISFFQGEP